jgi:hypothetical protein
MAKPTKHARVLVFPYADSLASARLDGFYEETHGKRRDFVIEYQEFRLLSPPELIDNNGQPGERVQGEYVPRRLRFASLRWLERAGLYTQLEALPLDHGARSLYGVIYFRPPGKDPLYVFFNGADEPATLMLSARQCLPEERPGLTEPASFTRNWSPPPALPARLVSIYRRWHGRYGGDPITIRLGARVYHRRLFVGGLDEQGEQRPWVDAVLNLGEESSRWLAAAQPTSADRWTCKGEVNQGMGLDEITEEAQWVIERLRAGQQVLVHCVAGFNRSVTICCAVLILLEGLEAEATLDRVREHHPWARPDPHHWLVLRWLARTRSQP